MKKTAILSLSILLMACESTKEQTFCFDEMTYSPTETVFKLFAPADARCLVVVGEDSIPMTRTSIPVVGNASERPISAGAIFTATVKGDHKGKTYEFVVNGISSPGVFAKAVTINGQKGVIADLRDTDPDGWADDRGPRPERYADWVVYEMHHRDFSIARANARYPGKFLALTEPWAINHLKDLGINAVHILPSYDFGSVDETKPDVPQYNWGYDPVNYNVPEGSYSTDATDPLCRIREFKQMVQALHSAGICVILDVVYNHTYDIEHSNFQRTFPDYYYRVGSNGSGCGNETASEQPMMRRFMVESVKHWINEYHIDGFRFDLMGCHDIETMNVIRQAVDSIDPHIFIYGEGWSAGACALPNDQLAMKANIAQVPRVAAFCDDMRDALRGPFSDDTKGAFLAGIAGEEESLKAGIAGMVEHPQVDYTKVNYSTEPWAAEPTQMMSYVSCHDDMCLVDRLLFSVKDLVFSDITNGKEKSLNTQHSTLNTLIRLDLLAQTAVFTSQGIPFMLSGEELLRSKQGVHNSFESPDSINQLDWTNKERYPEVFDYYKRLIALRRHHPAFRLGTAELVRKHLSFLTGAGGTTALPGAGETTALPGAGGTNALPECVVAYRLKEAPGDEWQDIIVILNANTTTKQVSVPEGDYTVVCRDGLIDEQGLGTVSGPVVTVPAQSALILYHR